MKFVQTSLPGVIEILPDVFGDERGHFFESYSFKKFRDGGVKGIFVQDNQSLSSKGVLRGIHYQKSPFEQGKLVRVVRGKIFDVAVDLRKNSPYFGKWFGTILSEENKKLLWIPEGFGHGFLTLEDNTILSYKCTNFYNKESDAGIKWNDLDIGINWPLEDFGISGVILSEKDANLKTLKEYSSNPDFI